MATARKETVAKDQISYIPLSSIVAKFEWNGRYLGGGDTPAWTLDSGSEEEVNDFTALKMSIADRGQDTPVTVRPKGPKFELVEGFRRFRALEELAKEKGDKNAVIKALVREYDDLEARLANARANTERDGYRPADLCWLVGQVALEYSRKKVKATQQALSSDFGITQPYLAKLLGICSDLDPLILESWRQSFRDMAVTSIYEISRLARNEQKKAWENLQLQSANRARVSKPPVERLSTLAKAEGLKLGKLVFSELLLPPAGEELDFVCILPVLVPLPRGKKELKTPELRKVVKAFKEAFVLGNSPAVAANPPGSISATEPS